MKFIDMDFWPRREIFDFFTAAGRPFYSVTFRLDVARAYRYAKINSLSFYHCMTWLVTKAANSVEAFRYSIEDGRVAVLDERRPSFTDMKKGADFFHICTMDFVDGDIAAYCAHASERSKNQQGFISYADERSDLLYISCLPWLELTGLTNEGQLAEDDCIPRISWGKAVLDSDERLMMGFSLEVNHRFIDGADIGKFALELERLMEEL